MHDAGNPPAHEPLEPAGVGEADGAGGVPQLLRRRRRAAAVVGADGGVGDPVVQAFVGSVR